MGGGVRLPACTHAGAARSLVHRAPGKVHVERVEPSERAALDRAFALAARGSGRVSPNPMVGAVLLRDGATVGEGFHDGPGTPHAEVLALREAGEQARGATLICTLEPCDHHGRTPPCTDAIIGSGIRRLVVAAGDPNPVASGRGLRRLEDAGIEVLADVAVDAAARMNVAYLSHVRTGRPYVRWKVGASLDGKVAARDGSARWITGPHARRDAHGLRAWSDAIVIGAGTALADDPSLTVRLDGSRARPPTRVVMDAAGRVPPEAALFDRSAPTIVATTERSDPERRDRWRATGADVVVFDPDPEGLIDPAAVLDDLGKREVQGVCLEGGPTLAWSFIAAGAVDEVIAYVAPKLLGGAEAPGILAGAGLAPVGAAIELRFGAIERLGDDLRMEAHVHRDR